MAKLSIASKLFEWSMRLIWPGDNSKLKKSRRFVGTILIWAHTTRRHIHYAILNDWGNYGYCRTNGGLLEDVKIRMTGYIYWQVGGYVRWAYRASGLAPWICKRYDHKIIDCSSAGPDSGNMDHECMRCGEYWHRPLY